MADEGKNAGGTTALVVIDMLDPYEHDDAEALAASVEPIVAPLPGLLARARTREVEVRHDEISVARDAVAHIDPQLGAAALTMMERNVRADVIGAAAALGPS